MMEKLQSIRHWIESIPFSTVDHIISVGTLMIWAFVGISAVIAAVVFIRRRWNRENFEQLKMFTVHLLPSGISGDARIRIRLDTFYVGHVKSFLSATCLSDYLKAARRTSKANPILIGPDVEHHNMLMSDIAAKASSAMGFAGISGDYLGSATREAYDGQANYCGRVFWMNPEDLARIAVMSPEAFIFDSAQQATVVLTLIRIAQEWQNGDSEKDPTGRSDNPCRFRGDRKTVMYVHKDNITDPAILDTLARIETQLRGGTGPRGLLERIADIS